MMVVVGGKCEVAGRIGVGLARKACRWFPLVIHSFSYLRDVRSYKMDWYLKRKNNLMTSHSSRQVVPWALLSPIHPHLSSSWLLLSNVMTVVRRCAFNYNIYMSHAHVWIRQMRHVMISLAERNHVCMGLCENRTGRRPASLHTKTRLKQPVFLFCFHHPWRYKWSRPTVKGKHIYKFSSYA